MKNLSQTFSAFSKGKKCSSAFTLLEVMIAASIFFMAVFAILELVSSNLRHARLIQRSHVDAGMLLSDLCQTNKLTEGSENGDFQGLYPGYTWTCTISQVLTNGFFKIDYVVKGPGGPDDESTISAYLYRPESTSGSKF